MLATDFPWATKPFDHQRDIWEKTHQLEGWAIHAEQGTGKAKIGIDTAAALALDNQIHRVLIVAPSEVHRNWVTDELPVHMTSAVPYKAVAYDSKKADSKQLQEDLRALGKFDGLQILTMTYDGVKTKKGAPLAEAFLKKAKGMMILDESQRIKALKAEQSKVCRYLGKLAKFRRAMTGTPMCKDPRDYFNPIGYCDPSFWERHGYRTMTAFTQEFAVLGTAPWAKGPVPVRWRQLDHLYEILKEISVRVLKKDVLDLPDKLYTKLGFDLSPAQRRVYEQLKNEFLVELEGGITITAPMAAVRITRLAQVACNYLPTGEGEETREYQQIDPDDNPRLRLLLDRLEDTPHQAIVWHRFREDGRLIAEACKKAELTCARYDGTVSLDDRQRARAMFKAGDVQFLIANPATISTGITLNEAKSVFYYSMAYNYEQRVQSEDRCHRIGQKDNVLYTDFVGRRTVDEMIVKNLLGKDHMAGIVNGDGLRSWLT
jgi:SNF2 family DNA or RNA helicase